MTAQTVTISLPENLYQVVRQRADTRRRTIEAELAVVIGEALAGSDESGHLPDDIAETVHQLTLLDTDDLWRAARTTVPPETSDRMQELVTKRQSVGLTGDEEHEAAQLGRLADRVMMVRAEAAALLAARGADVSTLLVPDAAA